MARRIDGMAGCENEAFAVPLEYLPGVCVHDIDGGDPVENVAQDHPVAASEAVEVKEGRGLRCDRSDRVADRRFAVARRDQDRDPRTFRIVPRRNALSVSSNPRTMIGTVKIPPVNGSGPAASTEAGLDIYPTFPSYIG
jgi:hypothetical protein